MSDLDWAATVERITQERDDALMALFRASSAASRLLTANAIREHEGLSNDAWNEVVLRAEEELDAAVEPFESMSLAEYEAALAAVDAGKEDA